MYDDKQNNLEQTTAVSIDDKVALLAELIYEIIETEDGPHD